MSQTDFESIDPTRNVRKAASPCDAPVLAGIDYHSGCWLLS